MPTRSEQSVDDRTLLRQYELESELRSIQYQASESLKSELEERRREILRLRGDFDVVSRERDELKNVVEQHRIIDEEEYASLKAAEHHLRRVLHAIDSSPLGWLARRRAGFRIMIERWPKP